MEAQLRQSGLVGMFSTIEDNAEREELNLLRYKVRRQQTALHTVASSRLLAPATLTPYFSLLLPPLLTV